MKAFTSEAILQGHHKYEKSIFRKQELYRKPEEIRTEFSRDYNRLHCNAFRREHKTQVFYAISNDHVCTRIDMYIMLNLFAYYMRKSRA